MGRKSQANERREQIVWALFDCLAENGHEAVTIKAIARRAGLPHGVIHYYFKNKDDIIATMISSITEKYGSLLDSALEKTPLENQNFEVILNFTIDSIIFDGRLNRVFYNLVQLSFERENVNRALIKMLRVYRRRIAETILRFQEENQAKTMSLAVVALIEGLALQWMIEPGIMDNKTVRELLERFINRP